MDTNNNRKEVSLWFCNGCDVTHLTADGLRLSFTRDEFTVFTRMVVETHCTGWPDGITRSFSGDHFDLESIQITASADIVH